MSNCNASVNPAYRVPRTTTSISDTSMLFQVKRATFECLIRKATSVLPIRRATEVCRGSFNKTAGYHWQIFCPLLFLKMLFKRMKLFFFEKNTLSSSNFVIFPKLEIFWLFLQKTSIKVEKIFIKKLNRLILFILRICHFYRFLKKNRFFFHKNPFFCKENNFRT